MAATAQTPTYSNSYDCIVMLGVAVGSPSLSVSPNVVSSMSSESRQGKGRIAPKENALSHEANHCLIPVSGNCAHFHKGGWWYNACGQSNLNGVWYTGGVYRSKFQDGIFWADYGGGFYSMKSVRMLIRPIDWEDKPGWSTAKLSLFLNWDCTCINRRLITNQWRSATIMTWTSSWTLCECCTPVIKDTQEAFRGNDDIKLLYPQK